MNKRIIVCSIAAAMLGSGLVWAADHEQRSGIAGWETLNTGMSQAVGVEGGEVAAAAAGTAVNAGAAAGVEGAAAAENGKPGNGGVVVEADSGSADNAGAAGASGGGGAVDVGVAGAAGSGGAGKTGEAGANNSSNGTNSGAPAADVSNGDSSGAAPVSPVAADGRINVNIADASVLMNLPGIGEKKAQAIIDYRSSKGAFRTLADLGKVKGIGPKMLEKLKPLVIF